MLDVLEGRMDRSFVSAAPLTLIEAGLDTAVNTGEAVGGSSLVSRTTPRHPATGPFSRNAGDADPAIVGFAASVTRYHESGMPQPQPVRTANVPVSGAS